MSQPQQQKHNDTYISLIERIDQRITSHQLFFSLECFPPKTRGAVHELIKQFKSIRQLEPLFVDLTWHGSDDIDSESRISNITLADIALNHCGLDVMLHIICIGITTERLHKCLERAKTIGIRNILALRGDKHAETDYTDEVFQYASDLIVYIRKHYGDYFTIAVAGYPDQHPESPSKQLDLYYLKAKVDAGADLIITQFFFESSVFVEFVRQCREMGITVPIIPGILPIYNYDSLMKIARVSQLNIPDTLMRQLEPIKDNNKAVKSFGIEWTIQLCRDLIQSNSVTGLHFYTFNREQTTVALVNALNLANTTALLKPLSIKDNEKYVPQSIMFNNGDIHHH